MSEWFQCTVKYEKTMENGLQKKVTEPYLVDAISFTEAERRIIEEISPFMAGAFEVSDIKRSADRFFKAKLLFVTLDEKSGKERKTTQQVLIQATDLRNSIKRLDEGMRGSMMDYTIASVQETTIMDVYHYQQSAPESMTKVDKPEFEE